ncbi:hypothetical protein ACHHV8_16895 [Paenibacillus sp. TAB 01]|uniref:hypothetical protein n=1 Tax=Paenibacillus sp. TAB 01 TaxID=3368988 RepID=UPI0037509D69
MYDEAMNLEILPAAFPPDGRGWGSISFVSGLLKQGRKNKKRIETGQRFGYDRDMFIL